MQFTFVTRIAAIAAMLVASAIVFISSVSKDDYTHAPIPMSPAEAAQISGGGCYKLVYNLPCPAPWAFGNDCTQWGCYYNASNTITCGVPTAGSGSKVLLLAATNLPSCADVGYGNSGYDTCGFGVYTCATGVNCPTTCFQDSAKNWWCMRSNGNVSVNGTGNALTGNQCTSI